MKEPKLPSGDELRDTILSNSMLAPVKLKFVEIAKLPLVKVEEFKKPVEPEYKSPFDIGKEADELYFKVFTCMKEIRAKHPVSNKFVEGTMPCPICKTGILAYCISDHRNGHIHATCSVKNCVKFAE